MAVSREQERAKHVGRPATGDVRHVRPTDPDGPALLDDMLGTVPSQGLAPTASQPSDERPIPGVTSD
jgi:hypothetical protein